MEFFLFLGVCGVSNPDTDISALLPWLQRISPEGSWRARTTSVCPRETSLAGPRGRGNNSERGPLRTVKKGSVQMSRGRKEAGFVGRYSQEESGDYSRV